MRRWRYDVRWEPGHGRSVLIRYVDTIGQLRAVVEWARANPAIVSCRFAPIDLLEGEPADRCPAGHRLEATDPRQPWRLCRDTHRFDCVSCGGHDVTRCPECGVLVIDPPPQHGCAAIRPGAQ